MNHETLTRFIQQLTIWASEIIEEGRSPFRKVETSPRLLSKGGEISPPLVFWINRDSFMAGGVLLFPLQNPEESIDEGLLCTSALGLKHFATWAQKEIVLWEVTGRDVSAIRRFPVDDSPDSPETFRNLLWLVLEEMKRQSVMNAIPGESLAPDHMANLFRETLRTVEPLLEERLRIDLRETRDKGSNDPRTLARFKGGLTLCRLIALILQDLLPLSVQPEKLERAMQFALESLHPELRRPMAFDEGEVPLPPQGSVLFHHLLRRLDQIGIAADSRTAEALRILLSSEAEGWSGKSLPPLPEGLRPDLLLNSDALYATPELLEVASPPLASTFALLRDLESLPPARLPVSELFNLPPEVSPRSTAGTLFRDEIPSPEQRKVLAARLRTSWPNRRFSLPNRTPLWAWEYIHLLGIVSGEGSLRLNLPPDWLARGGFAETIYDLIRENYGLKEALLKDDLLYVELARTPLFDDDAILSGPFGARRLPWSLLKSHPSALLLMALRLPDPLFARLKDGTLAPSTADSWPEGNEQGIFRYLSSSLGRHLWDVVTGEKTLPTKDNLRNAIIRHALPLPETTLLERLADMPVFEREGSEMLDKELAQWLDIPVPPFSSPSHQVRPRKRDRAKKADADLATRITTKIFIDGYPRFPEQYLYDYYRLETAEYSFSPPLHPVETFLGRVVLEDAAGSRIEIEGEETARALLLSATVAPSTSPIILPKDREITTAITDRYLCDLKRLRNSLLEETHRHLENQKSATRLARKIWDMGSLPPWEMLDEELLFVC